MKNGGFTLIELVITVGIIAILLSMGTMAFNTMSRKSAIEGQTKEMYADLMTARSEALYRKTTRTVTVTATRMTITDSGGATVQQKDYKQTMAQNDANTLTFNTSGVASVPKAYCVGTSNNPAAIDSIVVSSTIILTGKLTGGACNSANIQAR